MTTHVVLVCDSELSFLPLGNSSVVATSYERARAAAGISSLSIWVSPQARTHYHQVLPSRLPACPVVADRSLAEHVQTLSSDIVLIHDAQRPLTEPGTFERVANSIRQGNTAARPAHVVVDTLKRVDADFRVIGTVNRDEVQALTSPEGYLRSAITTGAPAANWSLAVSPLQRELVRGDQESLRVREPSDVLLVESFLIWQTREGR